MVESVNEIAAYYSSILGITPEALYSCEGRRPRILKGTETDKLTLEMFVELEVPAI